MPDASRRAIAIVGLGAILPDAPDVASFWDNVKSGRYSIRDVPPDRWDPALYYDPDPQAPDKTYSKIGGWVQEYDWDPIRWKLPIPPRVADAMDDAQKWGVACVRQALADYGHPGRPLDLDRTAVVFGNAMAGEKHYLTALRVFFPEFAEALAQAPSFGALPPDVREAIARESHEALVKRLPGINEDTMPGELANCLAGRVANLMNLHGPNFVTDAACASALAAIDAASEGLLDDEYDAVLVGGLDRNMGAPTFVKFCKIGALSATGTRPYADGADGFVMGEGAVVLLLKRLADAERAGDKIYAVLRGVGGSSDGKGKGITAPNPVGQKFAIERAWRRAGISPKTATLVEGHGTSTRVGDVVEVESLGAVLSGAGAAPGSIALGSVKSNIGHLKGAAGAAGILKAALALHEKVIPPSVNFDRPNPKIDFANLPLFVNTELRPWDRTSDGVRRAGVSAFGFGGTNFHCVLEEYVPGRIASEERTTVSVPGTVSSGGAAPSAAAGPVPVLEHAVVLGAADAAALAARLETLKSEAAAGRMPSGLPSAAEMRAPVRVGIQFGSAAELAQKAERARKALGAANPAAWRALRPQGVFHATGASGKVAFLYTGQGSQYANMLRTLRATEPEVAETFAEADRVMTPILGRPLSDIIFVDPADAGAMKRAEEELRRTEITQPAVLATDIALTRLLARYGITPDFVMGHSLGEYAALVVAGALPFDDALVAVAARGRTMASLTLDDNGWLAAVFAPLAETERVLREVPGHLEIANINSRSQAVIGGSSEAVERAMAAFQQAGIEAVRLPVSHAFHTRIVAPVSEPLRETLAELRLAPPRLPILSNVTGDFYPTSDVVPQMLDLLARQVASPVQFVKGLETLYGAGARVFVEVGPKKALHGFVEDVLGSHADVLALFTNHPKVGDVTSFEQALCGLYASGHGIAAGAHTVAAPAPASPPAATQPVRLAAPSAAPAAGRRGSALRTAGAPLRRVPRPQPRDHRRQRRRDARGPRRHHRRSAGPAGHRARLRRRKRGADPARRAVHRRGADAAAPGHSRQAHHAAGEAAGRNAELRRHRRPRRGDPPGGARRPVRPRRGVRPAGRSDPGARHRDAARHRRRSRCAARRRHPAGPSATGPPPRAPGCPRAGRCPRPCATTPASSSAARSRGSMPSPTSWRAGSRNGRGARRSASSRASARAPSRLRTAPRRSSTRSTAGCTTCAPSSKPSRTSSIAASCSACSPWATRSWRSGSAPAGRTPTSTPPARAPPTPSRWPRTGSAPAVAVAC